MIVGITGSIGSGKSLVASELARLGAYVIDLDVIARELVEPGMPAVAEIRDEFGPEYILEQGTLNRRALGRLVFSDPEALRRLNKIMFPKLVEATKERLDEVSGQCDLVVVDAAILYQAGLDKLVDKVIAVTAEKEIRIARIVKRDKLSYEEALVRVSGQGELDEIAGRSADLVINNSGTPQALRSKLMDGLRLLGIDVSSRTADSIFPDDE
ncbi:MAG TPA: dephospho-CoA kinase [Firmicutes bacterium]|nr:dephospho-CoA kinase [Bacillota bacterium]